MANSISSGRDERRSSVDTVICGSPALPRFVKIWITPLLAREPYSAAAAAPLMISIRSMSAGSRSARRLDGLDR